MFTKDELTAGSVIRVNSGYRYRPDGWVDLSTTNSSSERPDNVSTSAVIIDEEWWGIFNYRGFNISRTSGTISTEDGENFKIYVKI